MKITLDIRPTTVDVMANFMYGKIGIQNVTPVSKDATCMVGDLCITDYSIPDASGQLINLSDQHSRHYVDLSMLKNSADAAIIMIVDAIGFEPTELLNFEFFNMSGDKTIAQQHMHSVDEDDLLIKM